MANVNDVPATPSQLPTKLDTVQSAQLTPSSLAQVQEVIAPMVQQLVQAAGMQLSAADLNDLNESFKERGVISVEGSEVHPEGVSLNCASSCTYLR